MSVQSIIRGKGITVNVERRTESLDSAGSVKWPWAVNLSSVKLFAQPSSGSEAVRYARENVRGFAVYYAEPGQDIVEADRLTGGDLASRILDIQHVRTPGEFGVDNALAHMAIECQETEGAT